MKFSGTKIGIKDNVFVAVAVGLDEVDAVIVGPAMLDFALARGVMECFLGPFNIARFVGDGVNAVDGDVAVAVVGVAVDREDVLVFAKAKGFDGVLGGIKDGGRFRLFVFRPT